MNDCISFRKATICISYNTDTVWYIGDKEVYFQLLPNFSPSSQRMDYSYRNILLSDNPINRSPQNALFTNPVNNSFSTFEEPIEYVAQSEISPYIPPRHINDTQSFSSFPTYYHETQSAVENRSIASDRMSFRSQHSFPNRYDYREKDTFSMSSYSTLSSASAQPFPSKPDPFFSFSPNTEIKKKELFNPLKSKYKVTHCLNKGTIQCPLYSVIFQTTSTRLSVGHNAEFATYLLAGLFDEFINELRLSNVHIDGYYLNDHGFFIIVPAGTKENDVDRVVNQLSNRYSKKLLRSQRFRIPLDNQAYMNYLLYVAETTKG